MPIYTLAVCAAAVLIHNNKTQWERSGTDWALNTGDLGDLGDTYDLYSKINYVPRRMQRRHPLQRNQAVRDSIANTKEGKALFDHTGYLNYPGVSNAPGRVFKLKEHYRDLESYEDTSPKIKEKIRYCLEFLESEDKNTD